MNELVTNAMKYAFPGEHRGRILLSLARRDGACLLEVADDGVGRPEGGADGLGSLIVSMLVKQIGGSMSPGSGPGTSVAISFQPRRPAA